MLWDKEQIEKIYSGCRRYIISRAGRASRASRAGRVSCSCSVDYVTRAGYVVSA
jgi:hypothetical protein